MSKLGEVLVCLERLGVIKYTTVTEHIKPTHGSCCTCQKCGWHYDDCVCDTNEIIKELTKILQ